MTQNKCYIHDLNAKYEYVGLLFLDNKECTCISRFVIADYSPAVMREVAKRFPVFSYQRHSWLTAADRREKEIETGLRLQKEAIKRNKND